MALVSVIIPAYNSAETLQETVESALSQTYKDLEIIIVDDGSNDGTLAIAQKLAANHPNIIVLSQKNAGVAAARNTAIAASRGHYIAPLDADDLWHPLRIEMHVKAIEEAGGNTAVAYSPFLIMKKDGRVVGRSHVFLHSGNVFETQIRRNLVGNGSGFLATKAAVVEAGGYSSDLQHKGAQGCEDLLIQLELAKRYDYVSVPYYLIGYRIYEGNMSSNIPRMLRSHLLVYSYFEGICPEQRELLRRIRIGKLAELVVYLAKKEGIGHIDQALLSYLSNINDWLYFYCKILQVAVMKIKNKIWKNAQAVRFALKRKKEKVYFSSITQRPPATWENVKTYF